MAISKDKKVEIYSKLKDFVSKSKSIVFVNFHGLPVLDMTDLRKKLREEGIGYMVAKKTLIKKALGDASVNGDMPVLDGELALAFGDDLIAPAREVYGFQKSHKDNLQIVGGVFDGKYMAKEEMMEIATIPSTQVLYGQFVNLINSPIQQFVMALGQIADKKS